METELIALTTGTVGSLLAMILWRLYTRLFRPGEKREREEVVNNVNGEILESLKRKIFHVGDEVVGLIDAEIKSAAFRHHIDRNELVAPEIAATQMKLYVYDQFNVVSEKERMRVLTELNKIAPAPSKKPALSDLPPWR